VHKISGKCQKHKKKVISIFLLNNDEDDDSCDEAIQKEFQHLKLNEWLHECTSKREIFFISMNLQPNK
jgi:hypothetical protein